MSPFLRLGVLEEKFEAFWCILLVLSYNNGVRHQEITICKINAFQATKFLQKTIQFQSCYWYSLLSPESCGPKFSQNYPIMATKKSNCYFMWESLFPATKSMK